MVIHESENKARKRLESLGWNGRGRLVVAHSKQNPNIENLIWLPESLNFLCRKSPGTSRKGKGFLKTILVYPDKPAYTRLANLNSKKYIKEIGCRLRRSKNTIHIRLLSLGKTGCGTKLFQSTDGNALHPLLFHLQSLHS
jgi:hypothetical protein